MSHTDDGDLAFVPGRHDGLKLRRYRNSYSIEVGVARSAEAQARATAVLATPEHGRELIRELTAVVEHAEQAQRQQRQREGT
jgi:hypothetical protein